MHYPSSRLDWTLSSTLPCGAPTLPLLVQRLAAIARFTHELNNNIYSFIIQAYYLRNNILIYGKNINNNTSNNITNNAYIPTPDTINVSNIAASAHNLKGLMK